MSEMIERVAKAIWDQERKQPDCGHRPDWEVLNVTAADAYRAKAKAAIEAMREPTDQMIDDGYEAGGYTPDPSDVPAAFRAMIDAALK
jgi:hypothetical protein